MFRVEPTKVYVSLINNDETNPIGKVLENDCGMFEYEAVSNGKDYYNHLFRFFQ
jgi:hypothetical protein